MDDDEDEEDEEEAPLPVLKSMPERFNVAEGSTVWLPCEVENDSNSIFEII